MHECSLPSYHCFYRTLQATTRFLHYTTDLLHNIPVSLKRNLSPLPQVQNTTKVFHLPLHPPPRHIFNSRCDARRKKKKKKDKTHNPDTRRHLKRSNLHSDRSIILASWYRVFAFTKLFGYKRLLRKKSSTKLQMGV